jgi:hypothetical protein
MIHKTLSHFRVLEEIGAGAWASCIARMMSSCIAWTRCRQIGDGSRVAVCYSRRIGSPRSSVCGTRW